jgi:hypothetical protein
LVGLEQARYLLVKRAVKKLYAACLSIIYRLHPYLHGVVSNLTDFRRGVKVEDFVKPSSRQVKIAKCLVLAGGKF